MANPIIFRRNVNIGEADAESDAPYLAACFVDTGDFASLLDCQSPKCLVLGRTGSGKTALIKQVLNTRAHAVELSPEDLALNYVSNSATLRFFEEAGVSLDLFYTLLWRHVITVELLKLKYGISDQSKQQEVFGRIGALLQRKTAKARALKYINEWGDQFWTETEYRTKEFTRKLETDLTAAAKVDAKYLSIGAEGARKLSEEERMEVRDAGMKVVNQVQIKELHDLIELLSEDIFTDPDTPYYVLIDRLDEGWVDDRIRFKLIKALIEAVRTFKKVSTVKIIVALRNDLHYRVLKETVQPGFQEEKYRSLYLPVRWTREQLVKLLDDRVTEMFRHQYTRADVHLADILPPNQIEKRSASDYLLDRTFFRPREAIIYLNECIAKAEGKSRITVRLLRQAEVSYSQQRLISLGDEWRREYPNLAKATLLLEGRATPFSIDQITAADCEAVSLAVLDKPPTEPDGIAAACEQFYLSEKKMPVAAFCEALFMIFYQVGLIGVRIGPSHARQWSHQDQPLLASGQLQPDTHIDVHKTFWAALGIRRMGGPVEVADDD